MPQTELGLLNHKEWSIKTSFFDFNWYTITPPRWYTFSPALTHFLLEKSVKLIPEL